jgi:hypothetical protein
MVLAKVAFSPLRGFIMPRQFGPSSRRLLRLSRSLRIFEDDTGLTDFSKPGRQHDGAFDPGFDAGLNQPWHCGGGGGDIARSTCSGTS